MTVFVRSIVGTLVVTICALTTWAEEPWIVTGDVVVSAPMEVGDVIIAPGSSLTVQDLPEPGLRVTGNL